MLEVKQLTKIFKTKTGNLRAVDGVSFQLETNKILGIVGESGSGKSTLAKTITGLHTKNGGSVYWQGNKMPERFSKKDFLNYGSDIQMIFQDPYSALNPKLPIWQILEEPCLISGNTSYKNKTRKEKLSFIQAQLEQVGLRPEFYKRFPQEFSGGQQQRIGIARALMQKPKLLICDEPISSLDVSVQAQIINLLKDLVARNDMSLLFIAHDLAMVNYLCDDVAVMYLGKIVEYGKRQAIFNRAHHPYTQSLLASRPSLSLSSGTISGIPDPVGEIPSPVNLPKGCRFSPRCWKSDTECTSEEPQLTFCNDETELQVACFKPEALANPSV